MDHEPHYWLILEIIHDHGKSRKIITCWHNIISATHECKISSDITNIHKTNTFFDINTKTNTYRCYKSKQITINNLLNIINNTHNTKPTLNIKSIKHIKL